jgi:ATP-binding cassette subfamily C (CFTR/MRP) protein 1
VALGADEAVPQEAWVQSGSVSDNITFSTSAPADPVRAAEVIKACGLGPDMDRWDDREHTYIGERGITLSGGQRQRICVARAAYAESDIVLLDDPLSALDANVGHHLLHHCILSGPLAHRTRILVTHHLDVLPKADWIIMMDSVGNEGRISQQGTYAVSIGFSTANARLTP